MAKGFCQHCGWPTGPTGRARFCGDCGWDQTQRRTAYRGRWVGCWEMPSAAFSEDTWDEIDRLHVSRQRGIIVGAQLRGGEAR